MIRSFFTGLFLIFVLLLTGCAGTRMIGVVDPDYQNLKLKRLIVKGVDVSLMEENELISSFKKAASDYRLKIISGLDILPPTKAYSHNELLNIAQRYSADFILYFHIDRHTTYQYVPGEHAHSTVSSSGSFASVDTYIDPGHYEEHTKIISEFRIVDIKNGKTVWIANGNGHKIDDLSQKALSSLADKHLLIKASN